jgi:hypothetical protein
MWSKTKEQTNMKNTLKSIITILSIALVFIIFFITPTMLIPVSEDIMNRTNPDEMQLFFPLLIVFSLYISVTYYFLLRNTEQKRTTLFLLLLLANFILYPLMGLLESLFWGDAFKGVEVNEFIKIFLRFVLTFSLFSGFLAIFTKRRTSTFQIPKQIVSYKQVGAKILLIGLAYFVIYNLFGYFIAWQFEATREFYTGSVEKIGFFASMWQNVTNPTFVLVHIFRGILFGVAGYIFHHILKCSKTKKIIIMSLLFGGFGFQIVLPNPLLPEMVRISHFIETTTSMLLFGAAIGLIFSYKKRVNLPAALMLLLLASSCQKEPIIRFGFDCDYEKNSQGLTIMNVSSSTKSITLTGEVVVSDGEVLVELENPTDEIVFSGHLVSPINIEINESYQAVSGNWKLKYKSLEGIGSINLHLNSVK